MMNQPFAKKAPLPEEKQIADEESLSSDNHNRFTGNQIQVQNKIFPPAPDRVVTPGIAQHRISLHVANQDYLERRLDGEKLRCSPMSPGLFNFIPAHREVEALWQAEVELLSIYLSPTILERTAIENCARDPRNIELIDHLAIRDPLLEQLAYAFKTELENKISDRLYLESLQTILCAHLLRHHCSATVVTTEVSGGLPSSKLRQVVDYIQENLERDISLAQLANVAHVSSHHFGKLFKQSMGITPHQYVLKCRIEQAKKLLATKRLTLAEVSLATGFCHQSHFTNVFRRYTTLTPRQYRNQL
ncbi:MAG: AraC family transcriptional regulator [Xenococcaceae cyanobacterium MO_188.B29]|nr:AraC family transcriptional regulator [Xenococcaceae cyanobacterium MO_188.B29]